MVYKEITSEEFSVLLSKLEDKNFTNDELGCFLITEYNENINKTVYIAIDNTTSDLWTEEFTDLGHAIKYLKGEIGIDEVEELYNKENKYYIELKEQKESIIESIEILEKAHQKIDKGLDIIDYNELENRVAEGMNDILEVKNRLRELTNMKSYNVEIKEELSKTVTVEATSEDEARRKVRKKYRNEKIILDDTDFEGPAIIEIT